MSKIIVFFELGYIFNFLGLVILVVFIRSKKHIEGVSFYSQLLYSIAAFVKIFYFPYTILNDYWICWVEYLLTFLFGIYMLFLLRKYKRLSFDKESNYFDYRILLVLAVVLAFVSNYEKKQEFEYSQFVIRFSIILEALGLLPQLKLMRKEEYLPKFLGYYISCIALARFSRIFFWFYQVKANYSSDTYYTLIICDLLYILFTCDFIYFFFKYRNNNVIPYK